MTPFSYDNRKIDSTSRHIIPCNPDRSISFQLPDMFSIINKPPGMAAPDHANMNLIAGGNRGKTSLKTLDLPPPSTGAADVDGKPWRLGNPQHWGRSPTPGQSTATVGAAGSFHPSLAHHTGLRKPERNQPSFTVL